MEKARELADEVWRTLMSFSGCHQLRRGGLAKTPDLLPVLKQAGVVDSGGRGLISS